MVYDDAGDTTFPTSRSTPRRRPRVVPVLNTYGRRARACDPVRHRARAAPVVVVTMADGSDDPEQIDELCKLVERGVVIAAASRYMSGGQQIGGPFLKGALSRARRAVACTGSPGSAPGDATNSFKAYSTEFVREVGIDSDQGFEIGLELVAKARRLRRPVAEIPTIWLERAHGLVQLQGRALDPLLLALVPLRVRSAAHTRAAWPARGARQ